MVKTTLLSFRDLTPEILYELLKLRQDVFVVEQNCPYEDIDNLDQNALHLLTFYDKTVVACCRILTGHTDPSISAIGRIVVHPSQRGKGLGKDLIAKALDLIKSRGHDGAVIEAQAHLESYYNSIGFLKSSEPYDLDGIPHKKMKIDLR